MSANFARWLAARVDSLGLAVAAQTANLTVPGTGSLGFTPLLPVQPAFGLRLGRQSESPGNSSVSDVTRVSSEEDSESAWKASEESGRVDDTPMGGTFSGRRASEGFGRH